MSNPTQPTVQAIPELNPCPHCGGEAEYTARGDVAVYAVCSTCGACSSDSGDAFEAADKWNRRPAAVVDAHNPHGMLFDEWLTLRNWMADPARRPARDVFAEGVVREAAYAFESAHWEYMTPKPDIHIEPHHRESILKALLHSRIELLAGSFAHREHAVLYGIKGLNDYTNAELVASANEAGFADAAPSPTSPDDSGVS